MNQTDKPYHLQEPRVYWSPVERKRNLIDMIELALVVKDDIWFIETTEHLKKVNALMKWNS